MEYTKIYYLHKGDNIPFYIGKTKSSLRVRLANHKIKFNNPCIKIEEIDKIPIKEWKFWETFYISLFKNWGFLLENKNNGGGGLTKHSQDTKNKISKSKKNIPNLHLKGRKRPNLSKKLKGKKKNYKPTPEQKKKISMALKGKPLSEEHKAKIRAKRDHLKGRPNTWQIKPVLQYNLEGNFIKEFASQKEAQYFVGKPESDGVGAVCRGKQKTAYGYIWKFKE